MSADLANLRGFVHFIERAGGKIPGTGGVGSDRGLGSESDQILTLLSVRGTHQMH